MFIGLFWKKISLFISKRINGLQDILKNPQNNSDPYWFWLFLPFVFALGCIFYIKFNNNFQKNILILAFFFICSLSLLFYNFFRSKYFIYLLISSFLAGIFYNYFYDKFLFNYQIINFKTYLKISGKIEEIKPFYNPINQLSGSNLLIKNPTIEKFNFIDYQNYFNKKIRPSNHKKKLKLNSQNKNKLGSKKPQSNKKKYHKKTSKKSKLPKNFRNLINLKDFQEIDRKLIDYQHNYQWGDFIKINNKSYLAQPAPYINISVVKNFNSLQINNNFNAIVLFQPIKPKDFSDDFDFAIYNKQRKIGGYGFALLVIDSNKLKNSRINNSNPWQLYFEKFSKTQQQFFLEIRNKITERIFKNINQESGAIALALLIGDQSRITSKNLENIRQSGLSHLLSISGFHLSLACLFFLFASRYLLSLFTPLALIFDLKKISAFLAILASYCYLMISNAPIPAQRAFIAVLLLILSYFFNEKFNGKRALVISFFILTLLNPYQLFNLSFQLSFIAMLVLICFYHDYHQKIFNPNQALRLPREKKFWFNRLTFKLKKIIDYFHEVFLISVLIQITTLPFLIQSFGNFSLIAPITNIIAIPLTSLLIMPSGFLALALMPFALEKIPLIFMDLNIKILQEIISIFGQISLASIHYHNPSQLSLLLACLAILLFCLWHNSFIKILAIIIFISSFFVYKFSKNPALIIAGNQNSYALYHPNSGLEFSEFKSPTKQHLNWQKKFNQRKIKFIKKCDKKLNNYNCQKCFINPRNNYCLVYYQDHQIIVIKNRSQISQLCRYRPKIVVNLTKKYQLPKCYQKRKIKPLIIDNVDFINHETHKIFFNNTHQSFKLLNQF